MAFARFMSSAVGRLLRIVAGIALIVVGLVVVEDTAGIVIAVVGLVPLAAGLFDFCLIGPLLGAPLSGRAIRDRR